MLNEFLNKKNKKIAQQYMTIHRQLPASRSNSRIHELEKSR